MTNGVHPAYGQLGDVERALMDLKSLSGRLSETYGISDDAFTAFDKAAITIKAELVERQKVLEAEIDRHEAEPDGDAGVAALAL